MSTKISVALATYNGAKYIEAQLNSFLTQYYLPFELVVCDDGSTDSTLEIVEAFAAVATFPVRIYKNKINLGFSDNFIQCADLCRGDWIAFSDQDDIWLPKKLQKVKEVIDTYASNNLMLICHSADLVNEDLSSTGRRIPDYKFNQIKSKNSHYGFLCIPGFTTTFNAKLLSEINSNKRPRDYFSPDDKKQSHDKWIAMLANITGDIVYISESMALYRRHSSALSGSYNSQTATNRILKSISTGVKYYNFQVDAALDSARSLRDVSGFITDQAKKKNIIAGANKYDELALLCELRVCLYNSKKLPEKIKIFSIMLFKRMYFFDNFCSLGVLSFLKDLAFCFGFIKTTSN
jgi:glycosyltransferase involved in cell wall biosynthesis